MKKFLATISYDGSDFSGWAIQPFKNTIQGYIENKLNLIFKIKIKTLSSGRTDKFVHAEEQKFTFFLPDEINISSDYLLSVLKKNFLDHVFFKKIEIVDEKFHPIKNVREKEYNYLINIGDFNLFERKYCWQYCKKIVPKELNKILNVFCGYHDFFNFSHYRFKDKEKIKTKREIFKFESFFDKKKEKIIIRIVSKGFLRYQIRTMIGESIACYEGKETINNIIEKFNCFIEKSKCKLIAPPFGLYLKKISFY